MESKTEFDETLYYVGICVLSDVYDKVVDKLNGDEDDDFEESTDPNEEKSSNAGEEDIEESLESANDPAAEEVFVEAEIEAEEEDEALEPILDFLLGETDEYDSVFAEDDVPLVNSSYNYFRNLMKLIVFSSYYFNNLYEIKLGVVPDLDPIFAQIKDYKDVLKFFNKSTNREKILDILDDFYSNIEKNYIYQQRVLTLGLNEQNKKYAVAINPYVYLHYMDEDLSRPFYPYEDIIQDAIDAYCYALSTLPPMDEEEFEQELDDEEIEQRIIEEQAEDSRIIKDAFFNRICQLYDGNLSKLEKLIRYVLASNYEQMVMAHLDWNMTIYDEHIETFEQNANDIEELIRRFCTDSEYFYYMINQFDQFHSSILDSSVLNDRREFYEKDEFTPKRKILKRYDPFFKFKEKMVKSSD